MIGLNYHVFTWRHWGKLRNTLVRVAGSQMELKPAGPPVTIKTHCHYDNLLSRLLQIYYILQISFLTWDPTQ